MAEHDHHSHTYGVIGEFATPEELVRAATKTREAGYHRLEAYTPFPVEGLSEALRLPRNKVPLVTLIGGLLGGLTGFGFQYWANVISYPWNVGGRPFNSWPAWIPVTFELTVLGASLFATFGMLALNGLPQPHHPLFNAERFKMASTDRFFLCIEARDPKFELAEAARLLQGLQAQHVTEVRNE
jgi:Alternative complex III, ActD subunit